MALMAIPASRVLPSEKQNGAPLCVGHPWPEPDSGRAQPSAAAADDESRLDIRRPSRDSTLTRNSPSLVSHRNRSLARARMMAGTVR